MSWDSHPPSHLWCLPQPRTHEDPHPRVYFSTHRTTQVHVTLTCSRSRTQKVSLLPSPDIPLRHSDSYGHVHPPTLLHTLRRHFPRKTLTTTRRRQTNLPSNSPSVRPSRRRRPTQTSGFGKGPEKEFLSLRDLQHLDHHSYELVRTVLMTSHPPHALPTHVLSRLYPVHQPGTHTQDNPRTPGPTPPSVFPVKTPPLSVPSTPSS